MKLRLTVRAGRDLENIFAYIGARNPSASARVIGTIHSAFGLIAVHPGAGRAQKGGIRRFAVPRLPYLIFYRVDDIAGTVDVLTVRHAAREREP